MNTKDRETRVWENIGIRFLPDGRVLIKRQKRIGRSIKNQNIIAQDIDKAIKMQDRILNTYWETSNKYILLRETTFAFRVQKIFSKAYSMYLIWDRIDLKKRIELQKELKDLIEELRFCRNEEKKIIKEEATKMLLSKEDLKKDDAGELIERALNVLDAIARYSQAVTNISLKVVLRKEYLLAQNIYLKETKDRIIKILKSLIRTRPRNVENYFPGIKMILSLSEGVVVRPYGPRFLKLRNILFSMEDKHSASSISKKEIKEELKKTLKIIT